MNYENDTMEFKSKNFFMGVILPLFLLMISLGFLSIDKLRILGYIGLIITVFVGYIFLIKLNFSISIFENGIHTNKTGMIIWEDIDNIRTNIVGRVLSLEISYKLGDNKKKMDIYQGQVGSFENFEKLTHILLEKFHSKHK